jgi:hypothetical protein
MPPPVSATRSLVRQSDKVASQRFVLLSRLIAERGRRQSDETASP